MEFLLRVAGDVDGVGPVQRHTATETVPHELMDRSMGFDRAPPGWRSGSQGVYGWSVSEGKGQEATSEEKLFEFCLLLLLFGSETSEN